MPVAREHYPLLLAICASLFSTPLMMAGVNAILPEIGASFSASGTQLALVGASYSLGMAILHLTSGSLGDIAGHRFIFLSGAAIYGFASLFAAINSNMHVFLFLRFCQGIGGAMFNASGLALLGANAPEGEKANYLGVSGIAVYAGIACGPPLAGFITGNFGWHWIFWINAACCLCVFCIMKFTVTQDWRPAAKSSFDWLGSLFYALSMASLTLAAASMNYSHWLGGAGLLGFTLFLALFALAEKRASYPILDLKLLAQNLLLRLSAIASLVNYASIFGMLFYFSIYLQTVMELDVQKTGLALSIQAVVQAFTTPAATRLCKIWQLKWVSGLGSALCGCGLIMAAFISLSSGLWLVIVTQSLLGAGISLFALANTAIILESGGKKAIGQTSALTGAMRTGGQLLSMVFITLSVGWFLGDAAISRDTLAGFMQSMKSSLLFFGVLNLAAIGCALAQNNPKSGDEQGANAFINKK